jgi:hypothetical protein
MSDDETTEEPVEVDRQQDDDRDHPQDDRDTLDGDQLDPVPNA